MADTNQFPPRQTEPIARTVADITREGRSPQPHAYDAPDLSPLQFLSGVMHAKHLPLDTRIKAASALLPYTNSVPRPVVQGPTITIVIGGIPDPDDRVENSQSKSSRGEDSCRPFWTTPGLSYIEKKFPSSNLETLSNTPDTPFIPDYSSPPDPAVFAAARKWGLPEPHLCSYCGHWLTTTYPDCICGDLSSRDPSKLN